MSCWTDVLIFFQRDLSKWRLLGPLTQAACGEHVHKAQSQACWSTDQTGAFANHLGEPPSRTSNHIATAYPHIGGGILIELTLSDYLSSMKTKYLQASWRLFPGGSCLRCRPQNGGYQLPQHPPLDHLERSCRPA